MQKIYDDKKFNMQLFSKYRDVLFGIAIVFVIFHHLTVKGSGTILLNGYMFLRSLGGMGVDIFLFLSGMGLYYSYSNDNDIKAFYLRRFKRVLPAYFIVCIPSYIIFDILKGKGIKVFFLDLFQISYWTNGNAGEWYIAAIIVLYLLFPIIYRIIQHKKKYIFGITLVIVWLFLVGFMQVKMPNIYQNTTTFWARIPVFIVELIWDR